MDGTMANRKEKSIATLSGETALVDQLGDRVRSVLAMLGEDVGREGLQETPRRVATMLQDLTRGLHRNPEDELSVEFHENYEGIILVRDISFFSLCEHHLLPFFGVAHVAYHPARGILTGLSKIARVVEVASRRPQVQERLTMEIGGALEHRLHPNGVFVWMQAEHLCMAMRGIQKVGTKTVTVHATGTLAADQFQYQSLMLQLACPGGGS